MRPEVQKDFDEILNVMTGTDGGVAFVKLRVFLDSFDERAANGDEDAAQIVLIMRRFANIVRYANK